MKSYLKYVLPILMLAIALSFAACKKKEEPTAATATASTVAAVEPVTPPVPKPGEDLICDDCKTLFTTDKEYADHMEKTHPEKWAKMKDEFWKLRGGQPAPAGSEKK